ncbi:MAG: metallophosphoesterase [candidate division Zixibacteria bacterium]|nr:metallophosphoesterase [candidate division Zixibacteria bacterium]
MREFYPVLFAMTAVLLFGMIEIVLLACLNRLWWKRRWVRMTSWSLPLFGFVMVLIWALGQYHALTWIALPAAILMIISLLLEIALMISLPFSGALHFLHRAAERLIHTRRQRDPSLVDTNRRAFLKVTAASLPVSAAALSVTGVARAFADVNVFKKPILFDDLPLSLQGLRIFHLTDLHLAHFVALDSLSEVLAVADSLSPDLVVVTGDIADDLTLLNDALSMINNLQPPHGVYACLGNHEHFRGLAKVRRSFERSPVQLLTDQSITIDVDGCSLLVSGIDDPVRLDAADYAFFRQHIDMALTDVGNFDFSVLMSHRPVALEYASEVGVNLTLAGHTHGGQIGFMGRSLLEWAWPDHYLWGHYRIGASHLYTSSGAGHWFPFRLGCPREAPVIELRSRVKSPDRSNY